MPNLDPHRFLPSFRTAPAISTAAGCLWMAVLAFLLGICLTLLLDRMRRRKGQDARKDDSHEL